VANGRKSLARLEDALAHLTPTFGHLRARVISTDRVTAYVKARRDTEHAAAATINRKLAALTRMFTLGRQAGKIGVAPHIRRLEERNARQGFFERDAFEAVRRHLPPALQAVVYVAYLTGWRVASELLTRQWHHVDFKHGWVRLEPGETKNGEGRQFPLTTELRTVLGAQRAHTHAVGRQQGRIIPWVFHRDGEPIRTLRRPWHRACRAAGVPGRLLHDFRRTAVRNLERAGVPRSAAMKLVGHKTESIYRRYAIVDEALLQEQVQKLDALRAIHQASTPSSTPAAPPRLGSPR
jgi:integrase